MVATRNEWGENRVDKHAAFKRRLTMRLMSLVVMLFSVNRFVRRIVVRNNGGGRGSLLACRLSR